jgi:hypothetical protein
VSAAGASDVLPVDTQKLAAELTWLPVSAVVAVNEAEVVFWARTTVTTEPGGPAGRGGVVPDSEAEPESAGRVRARRLPGCLAGRVARVRADEVGQGALEEGRRRLEARAGARDAGVGAADVDGQIEVRGEIAGRRGRVEHHRADDDVADVGDVDAAGDRVPGGQRLAPAHRPTVHE